MKTTTKLLAGAVAVAIGGLAMTGIANAETTVTHYTDSDISYTLNGTELFTGVGTITISDSTTTITILDRNLGATAAGTGSCEDEYWEGACFDGTLDPTYGYHFQWGNNYGFKPCTDSKGCTTFPNNESTWGQITTSISYNPFYTDPVFRIGNYNWLNHDSIVDLWGGSVDDYIDEIDGNNWQVTNATGRQGPCPEGFHVPSYGEWKKILSMLDCDNDYEGAWNRVRNELLVPFAGSRRYNDAGVYDLGSLANLRSSSPDSAEDPSSRHLILGADVYLDIYNNNRANANSLRCVYDSYETYHQTEKFQVTIYDGTGDDKVELWSGKVESGQTVELPDLNLSKPNSYIVFDKWYTDPGLTEEFVFDTPITGDLELYAGYTESQTWIDRNGNPFEWDDITICDPYDSSTCITMMDRNLGAITAGTGCEESNLDCRKAGWENLNYTDYDDCLSNYYNDCRNSCQGEACCEILDEEVPYYCGGGDYEGFNTYEECEAENNRLINEYDECEQTHSGDYGYYYQWGNNHGFNPNLNILYENSSFAKWNISYNNYGYVGNLFIMGSHRDCFEEGEIGYECTYNYYYDYRENSQHYDGLRGGSGDSEENNRGYDIENHVAINLEGRQGPCPEGYHVPSAGEWNTVLDYYISENGDKELMIVDDGLISQYCGGGYSYHCYNEYEQEYCGGEEYICDYPEPYYDYEVGRIYGDPYNCRIETSCRIDTTIQEVSCDGEFTRQELKCDGYCDTALLTNIKEYFKIPFAGLLDDQNYRYKGYKTYLWSSSPNNYQVTNLYLGNNNFSISSTDRVYGNSVRCFKNTPDTENQGEGGDDNTGGNSGSNGGGNSGNTGGGNSGGGSAGGGSTLRKDNCPDGDYSDSYYDGTCGTTQSSGTEGEGSIDDNKDSSNNTSEGQGNNELQTAYEFAYKNGITTMDAIEKADMEGNLTRMAMAKMLSKYAINVLGKKPANTVVPQFSDITEELNAEYDYGMTLAYQLGIMGINMPDNKFRPFDLVTRAEFVTALSRLLYNTPDGNNLYYSTHMALLNKLGIITVTDPTMKELRGYVMIMLMRSAI